jgi:hypothetical protein
MRYVSPVSLIRSILTPFQSWIHCHSNKWPKPSKNLADLELLDMPGLTAAVAVVRPAYILLVHVDAHVPEVLEAVVHGNPLCGLALACQR